MSTMPRGGRPLPSVRLSPSATLVPVWALAIGLATLGGCGGTPRPALPPAPAATGDRAPAPSATAAAATPPPPTVLAGGVDLATLVEAAQRRHPTAQAVAAARRAAEARAIQAGTWANPELELSYGRSRPRISEQEGDHPYGARLSQRIEWWSKRSARIAVASAQVAAAEADSAAALLALDVEVRLAAIALASTRVVADQAAAQAVLAQQLAEGVAQRQALGDVDRGEAARLRLEATTARLRHDAARRAVAQHVAILRAWCGDGVDDGITIRDALTDPRLPAEGAAVATAAVHPRLRAAQEAERAAAAQVDAERQARLPDVTIGVFADREWEKDTLGVTLGFAVPLWDQGAGRIAEAEAARSQRAAQHAAEGQALARERIAAMGDVTAAAAELTALRDQAVPVAEEAMRLRTAAFQGGDASLADVLDARRAALAVQSDLLAARRRHAEAQVRLLAAGGGAGRP